LVNPSQTHLVVIPSCESDSDGEGVTGMAIGQPVRVCCCVLHACSRGLRSPSFFFAVIELELEGKRTVWFVRHHTHATYDGALYIQILVLRTTVLTGTAGYVLNCRSEHNERCFPLINIHYGR
jgi:hypothetical protein